MDSKESGFYGKISARGDFVSRRLPQEFITPWDGWLQSAISASKEQLAGEWLDIYLTSPIWRFVLSAGICGSSSWVGVLMPSVDRVGRYFPLTLAVSVDRQCLPYIFSVGRGWFETLEKLALTTLDDDFDLGQFDDELKAMGLPVPLAANTSTELRLNNLDSSSARGNQAFYVQMESSEDIPLAFVSLNGQLLENFLPSYSLWHTAGSEHVEAALIAYQGLPPIDAFTALLNGDWRQGGWNMQTGTILFRGDIDRKFDETVDALNQPQAVSDRKITPMDMVATSRWDSWGATTVGNVRQINEDAYLQQLGVDLWVVADGMGGHQAGDVASNMIVESLAGFDTFGTLEEYVEVISQRLQAVNRDLCELSAQKFDNRVVGSTVVVLVAKGDRYGYLWAGDSRLYRLRGNSLVQLTRDHALCEELSEHDLADAEFKSKVRSNVITRAVGAENELTLDVEFDQSCVDDIYLLCSDGLIKEVASNEIASILAGGNPELSARSLIDLAVQRGARDNVTVVVVRKG